MRIIESAQLYVDWKHRKIFLLNEGPYNLNKSGLMVALTTGPLEEFTFEEFSLNGIEVIKNSLASYKNRFVTSDKDISIEVEQTRKKLLRKFSLFHVSYRMDVKQIWLTDKHNGDLRIKDDISSALFMKKFTEWGKR